MRSLFYLNRGILYVVCMCVCVCVCVLFVFDKGKLFNCNVVNLPEDGANKFENFAMSTYSFWLFCFFISSVIGDCVVWALFGFLCVRAKNCVCLCRREFMKKKSCVLIVLNWMNLVKVHLLNFFEQFDIEYRAFNLSSLQILFLNKLLLLLSQSFKFCDFWSVSGSHNLKI